MLKTILFDNDGVLVDTEGVFFEANRHMLREFGLDLSEKEFAEISLVKGQSFAEILVSLGYSSDFAEKARGKRNLKYDAMLRERGESLVIPGVREVLEHLHGTFRIGVVTCCAAMHFKTIHEASGLSKFFDFIVKGEEFVHHKPHPEPYLLALKRSGSLPGDCIAVEDSQRGVESARNAGLRVAAIPRGISLNGDFSEATWRLRDIGELMKIVQGIKE